jgi:uncharacterized protein involved in exopolysaccharide biosynthesis
MDEQVGNDEKHRDFFRYDVKVLITTVKNRLLLISFVSVVFFVLAFLGSKVLIEDQWEASVMLIRNQRNSRPTVDVPFLYTDLDLNTLSETIAINAIMDAVIDRLGLDMHPRALARSVRVGLSRRSNVFHIIAGHKNPELAMNISNAVAEVFVERSLPNNSSSAEKLHQFYSNKRSELLSDIQALEEEISKFNQKHGIVSLPIENESMVGRLRGLELRKIENEMQIAELDALINNNFAWIVTTLQAQKTQLQSRYTEVHPHFLAIDEVLAVLEQQRLAGVYNLAVIEPFLYEQNPLLSSTIVETGRMINQHSTAKLKIDDINRMIAVVISDIEKLSGSQHDYGNLERKLAALNDQLVTVERRIMEIRIALESVVGDFEILQKASMPLFPIAAKRKMIAIGGGVIGLILMLFLVVFRELLDFRIKSPFDLNEQAGLECIGNLPDKEMVKPELFYAQFHILLNDIINASKLSKAPAFLTIGSDERQTGKSFIINEIFGFLTGLKKKVLYINTVYSLKECDDPEGVHLVNHFLIGEQQQVGYNAKSIADGIDKMYFLAEPSVLKSVYEKDKIAAFINSIQKYDLIIWELFPFSYNIQLASDLIALSNKSYFVTGYRKSLLNNVDAITRFVKQKSPRKLVGIINKVHRKYLQLIF